MKQVADLALERARPGRSVGRRRWGGAGRGNWQQRNEIAYLTSRITIPAVLDSLGKDVGRGGRARCPIHGGTNQSSFKYTSGRFYCFSCLASGDVITLVMKVQGVSFPVAAEWLRRLGGAVGTAPRLAQRDDDHRRRLARRRETALARWRWDRLLESEAEMDRLSDDIHVIERALSRVLASGGSGLVETVLDLLSELHDERDDAAWIAELLDAQDPPTWARLWQAERRGAVR